MNVLTDDEPETISGSSCVPQRLTELCLSLSQRASALITGQPAHPSCLLTDVFLLLLLLPPPSVIQ